MITAQHERVERRLAAILAADVVSYSRLIGADEEGTLRQLKLIQAQLIAPGIAAHNGRIFKTTGDGLLAEFGSVVDALRCASEIQTGLAERNLEVAPEARIEFRIGIHQGDIVVENGDIFGDGVNIAARLEELAKPGGICVSERVREDAAGKLDLPFADRGEQRLKNIARPVHVYAIDASGVVARAPRRLSFVRNSTPLRWAVIATTISALMLVGIAAWRIWPPGNPTASIAETSAAQSSKAAPGSGTEAKPAPRLSIVVLPFANLSNNPDQEYFADGVTEDLTTDLSQIPNLFVIARNTAFTFKGKPADAKQIGRELGVRYALEGSVRRSGSEVRVNAQLIDAQAGGHLWAERFDGQASELFKLETEITGRIAAALGVQLVVSEAARSTANPDAWDYILRARAAGFRPPSPALYREIIGLFERALAIEPLSVEATALLAGNALAGRVMDRMTDTPAEDLDRANELAFRASQLSPHHAWSHFARAQVFRAQSRCAEAIIEYQAAIAIQRNWASVYGHLAWCKFQVGGSLDETAELIEQSIRMSPRDPFISNSYRRLGIIDLFRSRIDASIDWLEKATTASPLDAVPHANLAAAYALKGMKERAAAELAEAQKLSDIYSSIARVKKTGTLRDNPRLQALAEPTLFTGLRLAGMPEE